LIGGRAARVNQFQSSGCGGSQARRQSASGFGVTGGAQSQATQVKALEASEASSKLALDATVLGYKVGVKVNLDVLNAQSQLYQTQTDAAGARYNYLLAQLKLRQAAGNLSNNDLLPIDALLAK